ncbi:NOL1/NOP2/sun family putative RNA methylase [Acidianus sulfidivorans JP7]|uniref:RNA methyltransferase n=1 Tax=Acidianus sulfidivorans JP7 TaxID=619593 RepID=A0A2U9IMI2_9CREN|nr:RsmB/NOP family class I SAM-dependent RNA methyltransferase [Acidianus sulfidivorans]AWR97223.1 NOL1/NOP2/sun family putative RNA methylase [Acidianus sulfidivorans JP7]
MNSTISSYIKKYDALFQISPSKKARELAIKYRFLDYMVERYLDIFKDSTVDFLESCGYPLKKSIRCNTLKISCNKLVKELEEKGFSLKKVEWLPHGFEVVSYPKSPSLGATIEYLKGYYYIQGLASMIPAYVLNPSPLDFVLDMAAAPGGKTTQLSQIMENKGKIVAIEKSRKRIRALQSNINRLGASNILLIRTDASVLVKSDLKFDKILLDAPCSGEGLIPEDQSRRTRTSILDLKNFFITQLNLLLSAYALLRKGGKLVYSTCSIAPEEDEAVVNFAIENLGMKTIKITGFPGDEGITEFRGIKFSNEIKNCLRLYPHKHSTEGFFICLLEK